MKHSEEHGCSIIKVQESELNTSKAEEKGSESQHSLHFPGNLSLQMAVKRTRRRQ